MKTFILAILLVGPLAMCLHAQDKTTFPSDDEIQLLLTQADRAMRQYKPLIDGRRKRVGKAWC